MKKGDVLWEADSDALQMGLVLSGRLKAVLRSSSSVASASPKTARTLQVILPGNVFGRCCIFYPSSLAHPVIPPHHLSSLSPTNLAHTVPKL